MASHCRDSDDDDDDEVLIVHARAHELESDDHVYFDHSYLQDSVRKQQRQRSNTMHTTLAVMVLCALSVVAMFGSTTAVMEETLPTRQLRKTETVAITEDITTVTVSDSDDSTIDIDVVASSNATVNVGNSVLDLFLEVQKEVVDMIVEAEEDTELRGGKQGNGETDVDVVFEEESNSAQGATEADDKEEESADASEHQSKSSAVMEQSGDAAEQQSVDTQETDTATES